MSIASSAPKQLRPSIWLAAAIATVIAAAGGAYAAVSTRAAELADTRDAVIKMDLGEHKAADRENFDRIGRSLERIEDKIDRISERKR